MGVPGPNSAELGAVPDNATPHDNVRDFLGDFSSLRWYVGTSASPTPHVAVCYQFPQAVHYIDFVQQTAGIWRIDAAFVREAKMVFARNVRWRTEMMVADEPEWQRFLTELDRCLASAMFIPAVVVTLEVEGELPAAHPARIVPA